MEIHYGDCLETLTDTRVKQCTWFSTMVTAQKHYKDEWRNNHTALFKMFFTWFWPFSTPKYRVKMTAK